MSIEARQQGITHNVECNRISGLESNNLSNYTNMNRKQNTSQTTDPAIAVDTVLAPVFKSGCEYEKCKHYIDKKCNDPIDWVNQYGQSVCGRRDDAIHPDDYAEMLENNPPMMNFGGNDSR